MDFDCCQGDCDCEALKIGIALGVAALALAVAVVLRRREALTAAREAIARARESSARTVRRELDKADKELREELRMDAAAEIQYKRALDVMRDLEEKAFSEGGIITILPPA